MTTFNTGNPVPSTDGRDLSDNAENFDVASLSQEDTWQDRLGVTRDTITGRLKKMGFAVPIPYAAGIAFAANDNVKTVEEANIVYAPLASALPFTTSGTFIGDDDARFFTIQGENVIKRSVTIIENQQTYSYPAGMTQLAAVNVSGKDLQETNGGYTNNFAAKTFTLGLFPSDTDEMEVLGNFPLSSQDPQIISNTNDISDLVVISMLNQIGFLAAKMQAGDSISIACFGDSTTDGNTTSGWTPNPIDGGGDAIGLTDHNLTAPNAWPAKLEILLRDMYNNNNINTFNAGYSGQRMDSGWAVDNYDTAVINNPFYGVPDVTFIAFGLNDIQDGGSQIDDHVAQTKILIQQIIDDGTVPVLVTSDASYRNGDFGAVRDHKEAVRELDSAKKSIALEFGIPLVDMDQALKDWIQNNDDGIKWNIEQPDGLHFGDKGHAFKAGFVTRLFFNDLAVHISGDSSFNTFDSAVAWVGDYTKVFDFTNNSQGGNPLFSGAEPENLPATGTDLMTMWLWNEAPDGNLIYLGLDNENELDATIAPKITLVDTVSETTIIKNIISFGDQNSTKRRSDEHYVFGKVPYGLSKVTYSKGNGLGSFYGGFKILEGNSEESSNALINTGEFSRSFLASTGVHVVPLNRHMMNNVAGIFEGETLSINVKFKTPQEGGVIIINGQGFDSTQSALDNNMQNAYILFRHSTDALFIYNVQWDQAGTVDFGASLASSAAQPWTDDEFEGRIEVTRESGQQRIKVFNTPHGTTTIIDQLIPLATSVRWGGIAGGLFYNSDAAASDGIVELLKMTINR